MLRSGLRFAAIVFTGLALIAPGAHLLEFAHKIGMPKDDYFVVQGIYRGWWLMGLFLFGALIANTGLALAKRHDGQPFAFAIAAAVLIAINLAIFFIWTQPANAATQNWTVQPENWNALRTQWEYSHAVNAGVMLTAFLSAALGALGAEEKS